MARFFDGFDRTSPVAHSVSVIKTIHLRLFMLRVVFRRVVCSDQSSLLSTHPTLSTFATSTVFWHMPSADDLQLYNHTDPLLCSSVLARFSSCVSELNDWMASNRLQLNPSKTEIIWLGTTRLLRDCPMSQQCIAGAIVKPSTQARDLGVMVDNELSSTAHTNQLTRSCYYYIRQLRSIRRSLTTDSALALVLALKHSRLDCCDGVLAGLPVHQMNQLQSVQRAAACLVLRLPARSSLSTRMTSELHWLPYPQQIKFKLCIFAYKCNHGMAPSYLSDLCVRLANVPGRSNLRSASNGGLLNVDIKQNFLRYIQPGLLN